MRWAFLLALGMLGIEIAGGLLFNSLALLADAGHVLGDALAVGLALGAIWLAGRPGGRRRTFGWARAEIMAAMLNGGALPAIAALIVWRAALRLDDDPDVAAVGLLALGLTGLAVNGIAAWLLHPEQERNLNVRGAYYHIIGDALGSVGALTAGTVILATGWSTIDAAASFAIAVLIAWNAVRLLREATGRTTGNRAAESRCRCDRAPPARSARGAGRARSPSLDRDVGLPCALVSSGD